MWKKIKEALGIHRHEWVDTGKTEWRGYDIYAVQEVTIEKCDICGKEKPGRQLRIKSIL